MLANQKAADTGRKQVSAGTLPRDFHSARAALESLVTLEDGTDSKSLDAFRRMMLRLAATSYYPLIVFQSGVDIIAGFRLLKCAPADETVRSQLYAQITALNVYGPPLH